MTIKLNDLRAGKTTFTVRNPSNIHYTYKVKHVSNDRGEAYFISVLTGPDNSHSYTYLGILDRNNQVILTKGSKFTADAMSYKVIVWALEVLKGNKALPAGYDIMPAGKCFKCGRKLTTPQSIETGYGPVCASS